MMLSVTSSLILYWIIFEVRYIFIELGILTKQLVTPKLGHLVVSNLQHCLVATCFAEGTDRTTPSVLF